MEQQAAVALADSSIRVNDHTVLRPLRTEDVEDMYTVIDRNRERLQRWLPWAIPNYSRNDAYKFVTDRLAEMAARQSFTATIRHHGALCGAIGLHRFDPANKSTSIGYWIDAAHEGKGIVTAACRAIVTEGFRTYNLHRIEIRCATWNHRSSAVPRRLDFVEEGILREAERLHDRWVDLRVFSMLAQDWLK